MQDFISTRDRVNAKREALEVARKVKAYDTVVFYCKAMLIGTAAVILMGFGGGGPY